MACFDNIVSLREYCTAVDPTSEIYLNDIGLTKEIIESIITGDQATIKGMLSSTINASISEIQSEIYGFFSSKIKTHSAIETGISGVVPDSDYTLVTGGDYRGQAVSLYNGANYLNFQLASVSLFLDTSGDIDVVVYDLDQDKLLDTIPITAVAGEIVEVFPAKVYTSSQRSLNLFIGYDSDGISSYKTLTRSSVCCGNYGRKTTYLKTNGVSISGQFISSNLDYLQNTAGVGIKYSIYCDQYSWLCTYSRLLANPIAHKVASEIYRRGWMVAPNSRTNNTTTTNAELLKANHEWHESKYREHMGRILQSIHLPSDSVCFSCAPVTSNKIILP